MNRERISKLVAGLCVTVLLVGMSCEAARAQTKLVKPANGGTIKIAKSGSYFLAGTLTTGLTNTSAIAVNAGVNNVTINLNGFAIVGPGATAALAGGINASASSGVTILNGTIARIAGRGIILGTNSTVAGVQVIGNNGDGIVCASGCLVTSNVVNNNVGNGLNFADGTSGYQNNVMSGNTTNVLGGTNMGHNVCGAALCP